MEDTAPTEFPGGFKLRMRKVSSHFHLRCHIFFFLCYILLTSLVAGEGGADVSSSSSSTTTSGNLHCTQDEEGEDGGGGGGWKCSFIIPKDATYLKLQHCQTDKKLEYDKGDSTSHSASSCVTVTAAISTSNPSPTAADADADDEMSHDYHDDYEDEDDPFERLSAIHVGEKVYHSPFAQYGPALETHLLKYKGRLFYDEFERADWYVDLGMIYRNGLTSLDGDLKTKSPSIDPHKHQHLAQRIQTSTATGGGVTATPKEDGSNSQYSEQAVNAFKQAIRIYKRLLREYATTATSAGSTTIHAKVFYRHEDIVHAQLQLASCYFQISEAYDTIQNQWALDYMKQAEKTYRKMILQHNNRPWLDEFTLRDAYMTRAVACVRIGVLILNDSQQLQQLQAQSQSSQQQQPTAGGWNGNNNNGAASSSSSSSAASSILNNVMTTGVLNSEDLEALLQQQVDGNDIDPQLTQLLEQQFQQIANQATLAEGYFQEAISIYRQGMEEGLLHETVDRVAYDMALALQNVATATAMRSDFEASVNAGEESIRYYEKALALLDKDETTTTINTNGEGDIDADRQDITTAMADLLFHISDNYLKSGQYSLSKQRYRESLQLYEKYNIQPPKEMTVLKGDATVDTYEAALEEYRALMEENKNNAVEPQGVEEQDEEMQLFLEQQQEGYEGDLHMSLGSLYMAAGDIFQATSHLTQAMHLYERSGEQGQLNMGDVKFTLAELYFRNGEYEQSIQLHSEALDIYRTIHGDGNNPLDLSTPQMQATVKFQLDPIDNDENDGMDDEPRASTATPERDASSSTTTTTTTRTTTTKSTTAASSSMTQNSDATKKTASSSTTATKTTTSSASTSLGADTKKSVPGTKTSTTSSKKAKEKPNGQYDGMGELLKHWYATLANETAADKATEKDKQLNKNTKNSKKDPDVGTDRRNDGVAAAADKDGGDDNDEEDREMASNPASKTDEL